MAFCSRWVKRGDLYQEKMGEKVGLKLGDKVYATVLEEKIILEVVPNSDEVLEEQKITRLTPEEAERISEEAQREAGIWPEH